MGEATVRLRALDGTWETIGRDRYAGLVARGVKVDSDPAGFATCNFQVYRPDPDIWLPSPELTAWAECEIDEAEARIFEGRVREAPISGGENAINIAGRGWQYHLDNDKIDQLWAHADLSEWRDVRTHPGATLSTVRAAGRLEQGDGGILLGYPNVSWVTGTGVAVYLDLGESLRRRAKRVVIKARKGAGSPAGVQLFVMQSLTFPGLFNGDPLAGADLGALSAMSTSGTVYVTGITNPSRYVTVGLRNTGATYTPAGDDVAQITEIGLYADATYHDTAGNGGGSLLKGSSVVRDALDAAPLLSKDRSRISTTGLSLRHITTAGPRTPRQCIDAVQAFHRYRLKVARDRVPIFEPFPTAPAFALTPAAARRFADSSAGAADELFNKVIVTATGPDGAPLRITRYAAELPENVGILQPTSDITILNPSAAVDTSHWTSDGGSPIVRETTAGRFHTSPAGFRTDAGATQYTGAITSIFGGPGTGLTGTFLAGRYYVLRGYAMSLAAAPLAAGVTMNLMGPVINGAAENAYQTRYDIGGGAGGIGAGTWGEFRAGLVPTRETNANLHSIGITGDWMTGGALYWDSFEILAGAATLLDRRGMINCFELNLGFQVTADLARSMADAFLRIHSKVAFKGSVDIKPGELVRYTTGEAVHPRHLVCEEGELLHLPGIPNPDTGDDGRDGQIVAVTYEPRSEQATASIDNQRDNFQVLLDRYAYATGQGGGSV